MLVASAGMTIEPVSSAKLLIVPIRIATGALVKTNFPPASATALAVFHAIDWSSSAPKIIPLFPSNILWDMLNFL